MQTKIIFLIHQIMLLDMLMVMMVDQMKMKDFGKGMQTNHMALLTGNISDFLK